MWNLPNQKRLCKIPKVYETDHIDSKEKLIYLHFFIFGCDWYIAEFDGDDTFYGYSVLNNDLQNAEWGYISFSELKSICINAVEVDCELQSHWKIQPAKNIKAIGQYL